jgi:hypothetical protein
MGVLSRECRCHAVRWRVDHGLGASEPTQNGVHESGCTQATSVFGQCHAGIDGCVSGHSFERSELVGSQSQDVLQLRRHAVPSSRDQGGQLLIEVAPLSQHPCSKLVGQAAILLAQPADSLVKRGVKRPSLPDLAQNLESGAAGADTGGSGRHDYHQRESRDSNPLL